MAAVTFEELEKRAKLIIIKKTRLKQMVIQGVKTLKFMFQLALRDKKLQAKFNMKVFLKS